MMELLTDPQAWITLITLSAIEIVLGIDNLVFISIAVSKLPVRAARKGAQVRHRGRLHDAHRLAADAGLARAPDQTTLFTLFGKGISVRDLVLILGGVFLLVKGTMEIRDLIDGRARIGSTWTPSLVTSFAMVIAQIAVIDIVFSLDSVIAAVGMANHTPMMVAAILLAVAVMLLAAKPLGHFIDDNPTIKMLALAFIVLVGVYLIVDGFEAHMPKRLYLRRHGLLGAGRMPEPVGQAQRAAAPVRRTERPLAPGPLRRAAMRCAVLRHGAGNAAGHTRSPSIPRGVAPCLSCPRCVSSWSPSSRHCCRAAATTRSSRRTRRSRPAGPKC